MFMLRTSSIKSSMFDLNYGLNCVSKNIHWSPYPDTSDPDFTRNETLKRQLNHIILSYGRHLSNKSSLPRELENTDTQTHTHMQRETETER